ncbi:MAG TPA: glutaredoxin family protein [Acidovorax sp.]|nr:glutaredoxin family protein [Acidovorax sp.]
MPRPTFTPAAAGLLMALVSVGAQAQAVYRIVGPDGKVTFSDRPPAEASAQPARSSTAPASPATTNGALPYELRQIANRYPVTIYTGSECAPCGSLRNLLTSRGVPYTERTVVSNEDIAALQRLSGSSSLPFGTIGGQQLVGFSDAEWVQYLDAAGYPKQSQLPSNYRQPAPTPLVAAKPVETAPAAEPKAPARPVPPPPANDRPTPSNPAGIRF